MKSELSKDGLELHRHLSLWIKIGCSKLPKSALSEEARKEIESGRTAQLIEKIERELEMKNILEDNDPNNEYFIFADINLDLGYISDNFTITGETSLSYLLYIESERLYLLPAEKIKFSLRMSLSKEEEIPQKLILELERNTGLSFEYKDGSGIRLRDELSPFEGKFSERDLAILSRRYEKSKWNQEILKVVPKEQLHHFPNQKGIPEMMSAVMGDVEESGLARTQRLILENSSYGLDGKPMGAPDASCPLTIDGKHPLHHLANLEIPDQKKSRLFLLPFEKISEQYKEDPHMLGLLLEMKYFDRVERGFTFEDNMDPDDGSGGFTPKLLDRLIQRFVKSGFNMVLLRRLKNPIETIFDVNRRMRLNHAPEFKIVEGGMIAGAIYTIPFPHSSGKTMPRLISGDRITLEMSNEEVKRKFEKYLGILVNEFPNQIILKDHE